MNGKKARQIRRVSAQMNMESLDYAKQRLWGEWQQTQGIPSVTARRKAAGADKVLKKAYLRGMCRVYQSKELTGMIVYGAFWV